jgi:hypothetical protein
MPGMCRAYFFKPRSSVDNPVPPPMATTRKARLSVPDLSELRAELETLRPRSEPSRFVMLGGDTFAILMQSSNGFDDFVIV